MIDRYEHSDQVEHNRNIRLITVRDIDQARLNYRTFIYVLIVI